MTILQPQQQLGMQTPQMNQYTMSGITSAGVLVGALLAPFIFNALKGSAESPTAVVRRNLAPMVVGGLVGGALFGSSSLGLWLYQRGM
jgi:hypothetical protein